MTIKEFEEKVMEILRSPMWGTNDEATKWKVHEIMKLAEASAEKNVDKTCTAGTYGQCQYRYMNGALSYGCKYAGYCDYQLPKDSRQLGKVVKTERICQASLLHQKKGRKMKNEEVVDLLKIIKAGNVEAIKEEHLIPMAESILETLERIDVGLVKDVIEQWYDYLSEGIISSPIQIKTLAQAIVNYLTEEK